MVSDQASLFRVPLSLSIACRCTLLHARVGLSVASSAGQSAGHTNGAPAFSGGGHVRQSPGRRRRCPCACHWCALLLVTPLRHSSMMLPCYASGSANERSASRAAARMNGGGFDRTARTNENTESSRSDSSTSSSTQRTSTGGRRRRARRGGGEGSDDTP